jgi:hypothetical protein
VLYCLLISARACCCIYAAQVCLDTKVVRHLGLEHLVEYRFHQALQSLVVR